MPKTDWLPWKQEERLEMAKNWLVLMKQKGKLAWKMEQELLDEFEDAVTFAQDEFFRPKQNRTAGTNVQLRQAFEKLAAQMRDIKKRYFYVPPLTEADIVNLGLRLKDDTPTSVSIPTGQAEGDISYLGGEQLMMRIRRVEGTPLDGKAEYGHKIYYRLYAHGETPPAIGKDLHENVFTRQKKYLFRFGQEDKGKTAYFCIRYENSKGEQGPWGPMFSAIIP